MNRYDMRLPAAAGCEPMPVARWMMQALAGLLILVFATAASSHNEPESAGAQHRVLGELNFPTSTHVVDAQAAFTRGLLLLHLFEYRDAADEFRQAQSLDPGFAMAYWGEAMTYTHPIWDEQDVDAARAVLLRFGPERAARLARVPTARERGFFEAVEALYGEGTKAQRDAAHLALMERLAGDLPDDEEVQLFLALALFGKQAGVRDVATYMQATAIAERVFCRNPQHPGAAHYLIHGVDDPTHATLGLDAARVLAKIAPDAPHAQHMTSHIFLALGRWDDVAAANEAAGAVARRLGEARGAKDRNWGHGKFWLLYAYLQQGRIEAARSLLLAARNEIMRNNVPPTPRGALDPDTSPVASVVQMWARYVVETGDWTGDIAAWKFKLGDALDPQLNYAWVQSFRAARANDAHEAGKWLDRYQVLRGELRAMLAEKPETAPFDYVYLQRADVMESELQAALTMAMGRPEQALSLAAGAVRLEAQIPDTFGPPLVDYPARELLGDLQMRAGQFAEAQASFQQQLQATRLRSPALFKLSQAAVSAGQANVAAQARKQLEMNWQGADQAVRQTLGGAP